MAKYRPKLTLEIVPFTEDLMDGVDFMPIFSNKIIQTMTKEDYLGGAAIPKTNRKYFINTMHGKEYFNESEYVAFGIYGKFKVTEDLMKEYELVEE